MPEFAHNASDLKIPSKDTEWILTALMLCLTQNYEKYCIGLEIS